MAANMLDRVDESLLGMSGDAVQLDEETKTTELDSYFMVCELHLTKEKVQMN